MPRRAAPATTPEVVEFTDPGCSWAWGTEPKLRLLRHRYGDRVRWRRVLGGLVRARPERPGRPFDPVAAVPRWIAYWRDVGAVTGAPFPAGLARMYRTTDPACLAAKAAEGQGPALAARVLRRLREATFAFGEPPDDGPSVRAALTGLEADGLDLDALVEPPPEVRAAFEADCAETRDPDPWVVDLDDPGEGSGRAKRDGERWRYVFPTVVVRGPGGQAIVPGWKPYEHYVAALEAAAPGLTADPPPDPDPAAALARYGSLTSVDLAVLCGGAPPPAGAVVYDAGGGPLWLAPAEASARGLPVA